MRSPSTARHEQLTFDKSSTTVRVPVGAHGPFVRDHAALTCGADTRLWENEERSSLIQAGEFSARWRYTTAVSGVVAQLSHAACHHWGGERHDGVL
jgi:hypothetical protein